MKSNIIFSIVAVIFLWTSCKHDPIETAPLPSTQVTGDTICFNTQILPLFTTNCGTDGCHSGTSPQKGLNLTNYAGIRSEIEPFKPEEGDVMEEILEGEMPPNGPLTPDQKGLLVNWILQGAQNTQCVSTCDTISVTYTKQIAPLVQTRCAGCHSGASAGGGIQLTSYTTIKQQTESGKLLCAIKHASGCKPMPKNAPALESCQIRIFELWVNSNYPQ